jgi:MFS transporter, UMF1 family
MAFNNLFALGGIYAAGTFKLSMTAVLLFGISIKIRAGF